MQILPKSIVYAIVNSTQLLIQPEKSRSFKVNGINFCFQQNIVILHTREKMQLTLVIDSGWVVNCYGSLQLKWGCHIKYMIPCHMINKKF